MTKVVLAEYQENEKALAARLGMATAVNWDNIPPMVRDIILRQAVFVHDVDDITSGLNEDLQIFISMHKEVLPKAV